MQKLPNSNIEIPLHSRVAIQCKLKEFVEVGDHYLYICNVEEVYGNEEEKKDFFEKSENIRKSVAICKHFM